MLQTWIDRYCRLLSVLMVACLALMVVLVFGNVVMRYAFNSGFTLSEELSRWLFVWMGNPALADTALLLDNIWARIRWWPGSPSGARKFAWGWVMPSCSISAGWFFRVRWSKPGSTGRPPVPSWRHPWGIFIRAVCFSPCLPL